MPQLHGSGNIFRLDGQAGFDEGIVRGKVGGESRLTFEGDFALCHGLDAQVSARAMAAIDGQLTALFLLSGRAHGEAFAAASAGVEARLSVDLFDSFGFAAAAEAAAEASVAGRLSLFLDVRDIAAFLQTQLNHVAYDIIIAFFNEVSIGGGVWGQLSAAAMARAHLRFQGSLSDDSNAGFIVEIRAGVGAGAGAGFEGYLGIKLENPKRFYLYAVERITREVVTTARSLAPPEVKPAIPLLELALPTVLNASYEIAQTPMSSLATPEAMASTFVKTFAAQMQRFLLDKLVECGAQLLRDWLEGVVHDPRAQVAVADLDSDQHAAIEATLDSALQDMQNGALDWETFEHVFPKILDSLAALFPEHEEEWRFPLTVLWTAVTAVNAIRTGVGAEYAGGSISLIGLPEQSDGFIALPLPEPPAVVRAELDAFLGDAPNQLTVDDAISYLVGSGIAVATPFVLPDLQTALDLLARHTEITIADIVSGILRGAFTEDVVHRQLYIKLRGFFQEALDSYVINELLPALRDVVGPTADARIWMDEVAEPTVQMASAFLFDRLDAFVSGTIASSDLSPVFNSFRTALSHLVSKIITRNVVVVADIVHAHAIDSLEQGFTDLESRIRSDPNGIVSLAAAQVATLLLPPFTPIPPTFASAAQQLFADLAGAGAVAFGPGVYTEQRREQTRRLMIRLLDSIDGEVDYSDGEALDNFFRGLCECIYVPDPEGLVSLLELQASTLSDQAELLFPRVLTALELFYLRLSKEVVDQMFDAAEELVRQVADLVSEAWEELKKWRDEYRKWENAAIDAARDFADQVELAADILKSSDRRQEIIDQLRADGSATAERIAGPALAAGAVVAFNAAFDLAEPHINRALRTLGDIADDLGDLIDDAADLRDLRDKLAAKVRDDVIDAINDVTGLELPEEIGPELIGQVAADIIHGLRALRNALEAALGFRIAELEAEQKKLEAQGPRDAAQLVYDTRRDREVSLVGEPVRIQFAAPLPPTGPNPPVFGAEVQMILLIEGARPTYVEPGGIRRVLVAINGQPLNVAPTQWQYHESSRTLSFSTMLTAAANNLRSGLNVIECSVTDGTNAIARASAPFAVNMALPVAANVQLDRGASVFDAPGADHLETSEECVALENLTSRAVELRDWSVRDAIGHAYVFGDVTMMAGARLTLHTGPGTDVTTGAALRLFQGKNRAIWNNTGDTALLVDPSGVTRSSLTYLPGRGLS